MPKKEEDDEPGTKRTKHDLYIPKRKNGIICRDLEELVKQINTLCNKIIKNSLVDLTSQTKLTIEELVIEQSSSSKFDYQLNATELEALDHVKGICEEMDDSLENDKYLESFSKKEKTSSDILNMIEIVMQRCIRIAKKLPEFRELSSDSKFALLKKGMIEIMTVRGAELYNSNTNSFDTPVVKKSSVDLNEMFSKLNDCSNEQKQKCLEFFEFLDVEVRTNKLAMKIFTLAVLFTVRETEMSVNKDFQIITMQHNHYLGLLKRYLESLYGNDAHRISNKIPIALDMLKDIAKGSALLFVGVKKNDNEQSLSNELFEL